MDSKGMVFTFYPAKFRLGESIVFIFFVRDPYIVSFKVDATREIRQEIKFKFWQF